MEEGKIYLDEEGYKQYLNDIENLKSQLEYLKKEKTSAHASSEANNWHDNSAMEMLRNEEYRITKMLRDMLDKMNKIVIVDKAQSDNEVIDINDIVSIHMQYNDEDLGTKYYKLVATERPNINSVVNEVSLNSPLGKSIYLKNVGYSGSYKVLNNTINFSIISKNNGLKL